MLATTAIAGALDVPRLVLILLGIGTASGIVIAGRRHRRRTPREPRT